MIPKLIHQLWKTTDVPESFAYWQKSWINMHPDYKYKLWTNEDIENFIHDQCYEIQELFYDYDENICRFDLARYLILQKFGGLYVDLDFECIHSHHKFLEGHQLMMGLEPETHAQMKKAERTRIKTIVCNAWLASIPNHPFWSHLLDHLKSVRNKNDVLDLTGPFALTYAVSKFASKNISIIPSKFIYPIDKESCLNGKVQDLEFFDKKTSGSFAIHHCAGTWFRPKDYLMSLPLPLAKAFLRIPESYERSLSDDLKSQIPDEIPANSVKVSCLMVTRGNRHRVRQSIKSFLNQTIISKELVIVTDVNPHNLVLIKSEISEFNIQWILLDPLIS